MTIELDRIYCQDCVSFMEELGDEGIDLTITSPHMTISEVTMAILLIAAL